MLTAGSTAGSVPIFQEPRCSAFEIQEAGKQLLPADEAQIFPLSYRETEGNTDSTMFCRSKSSKHAEWERREGAVFQHPKEDSVERAVLSGDFGTSTETSLTIKQSGRKSDRKRSEVFEGKPSLSLMSVLKANGPPQISALLQSRGGLRRGGRGGAFSLERRCEATPTKDQRESSELFSVRV